MKCIICEGNFKHSITECQYVETYDCPHCEAGWMIINNKVKILNTDRPGEKIE